MKKLFALLLVLALLLPCIALGETLTSEDGVCVVTLPDGYYLDGNAAMAPDKMGNLNIQHTSFGFSMDMIVMLKDTLDETFTKQYVDTFGVTEDDITTHDIITVDDRQWYRIDIAMSMMGVDFVAQQYITVCGEENDAYLLTFTAIDDAEVQYMLENVAFNK